VLAAAEQTAAWRQAAFRANPIVLHRADRTTKAIRHAAATSACLRRRLPGLALLRLRRDPSECRKRPRSFGATAPKSGPAQPDAEAETVER
jgi:hypothetical protein